MPDISKCVGNNCPLKKNCYRYTSKDDIHQLYSDFQYVDGNCDYYWKNK